MADPIEHERLLKELRVEIDRLKQRVDALERERRPLDAVARPTP